MVGDHSRQQRGSLVPGNHYFRVQMTKYNTNSNIICEISTGLCENGAMACHSCWSMLVLIYDIIVFIL
jgi:hypothetical protein